MGPYQRKIKKHIPDRSSGELPIALSKASEALLGELYWLIGADT